MNRIVSPIAKPFKDVSSITRARIEKRPICQSINPNILGVFLPYDIPSILDFVKSVQRVRPKSVYMAKKLFLCFPISFQKTVKKIEMKRRGRNREPLQAKIFQVNDENVMNIAILT